MSELKLMPFQDEPFNGDTYVCEEFLHIRDKYGITTAVETGSCLYSTTKWLGENFEKVHTVEINPEFARHGVNKVSGMANVNVQIGDSVTFLRETVSKIKDERTIFFLDAHWLESCPLLSELQEISNMITPPIIVIHDFYTGDENLGYDTYNGQPFNFEWISAYIHNIEHKLGVEYSHYYNKVAEGAKRGLIYIHP